MKVIVLPGLDGDATLRRSFQAAFSEKYDVSCLEYPADQKLDYATLAAFVLERLPSDECYCLVAESFSGPIAIEIAAKSKGLLRAVVFVASFAMNPVFGGMLLRPLAKAIPYQNPVVIRLALNLLLGTDTHTEQREKLGASVKALDSGVILHRLDEVLLVNKLSLLSSLECPMLYIRAKDDFLVRRSAYQRMKSASEQLEINEIDGPHFLLGARPAECAQAVESFLARC